ncbi:DNA/RNA non-specific endonuclease [Agromyces soli]|uniref:DNA/RNA non-specific endonuclease n=1 Tax=Agromyces soli TaxID=659012 RepID=A0ABY4B1T5_9MICO|nr:DNA/RNA non-specific endonuclease [Agromyces soli]UOE26985.1 DNA/RNA non-specific endonuclease [Agromyces soli]
MGYETDFLGGELPMPVPLPLDAAQPDAEPDTVLLDYVHFSVRLDQRRRLARVTGVNLDGAQLVERERSGDRWRLDPRIPADWQTGPAVYADNPLDRGHLVRRRDPVWGDPAVAARAESDTFHYPNAAPQAAGFNQSKELWLGLEDHVLAFGETERLRLSVFTAPVLALDDPPYRGIRLPRRFFKVVAWLRGERLAAAGFVLDQSALIASLVAREAGALPELGGFRTFQAPIAEIAELARLAMPQLVAADRMPRAVAASGWRELSGPEELLL